MLSNTLQDTSSCGVAEPHLREDGRIVPAALAELTSEYGALADLRAWPLSNPRTWPALDRAKLTAAHASILRFITFIEDHIPGYFTEYMRLYPLDATVSPQTFAYNREMFRFSVRWALEEERHAQVLAQYQIAAELAEPDTLRTALAVEGRKPFQLDHAHDVAAIVTYTFIQEKATQIFYRQFARALREPALAHIIAELAKDEARHFAFFSRLLELYLLEFGEAVLPSIQAVLNDFKMPLSMTLKSYWRWSIEICDETNYDHTEAFEFLSRLISKTLGAARSSKTVGITDFVRSIRGL